MPIEKLEFHNVSTKTATNNTDIEPSSIKPSNENYSIIKSDLISFETDMISVGLKMESTAEEQASQNVSQHESCYIQVSNRLRDMASN